MSSASQLKEYERLFALSQGYDPAKFSSDFERAYGEATNYNKDLITDRNNAIGEMQALPGQLSEQYYNSPVRNPLAQEALIGTRKANISSNIGTLTDLLTARRARYEDVLSKQLAAYESDAQRAQQAAENQWRLYQDALNREEAARARAAAQQQTGPTVEQILAALKDGGNGGGGDGGDEIIIDTGGPFNTLDKVYASDWFGADFSQAPKTAGSALMRFAQAGNPLTWLKTSAGLLGNYIGNKNQKNKNFFQKLLNR